MEIDKLFTAIGLSVQQAQEYLSHQDMERYMQYFKSENLYEAESENAPSDGENTVLLPRAIRFSLGGKEKSNYIDVPIAVMTPHEPIGLKQVKVKVNGNMYEDMQTQKIRMHVGPSDSENAETQNGTIEMIFESSPQSEGQARANQKMMDKTGF